MVESAGWREALERYRWNDRYLAGDEFATFLESEEARVVGILKKLGTGGDSAPAGPYPLLVLAGLAIFALLGGHRPRPPPPARGGRAGRPRRRPRSRGKRSRSSRSASSSTCCWWSAAAS